MCKRPTEFLSRFIFLFSIIFSFQGCASYTALELGPAVSLQGEIQPAFGVIRNGFIIPEYVLNAKGEWPSTEEEAWKRFNARPADLESFIREKYVLPNDTLYQMQRIPLAIGLILISPIALPVMILGSRGDTPPISAGKVADRYWKNSLHSPKTRAPMIRESTELLY